MDNLTFATFETIIIGLEYAESDYKARLGRAERSRGTNKVSPTTIKMLSDHLMKLRAAIDEIKTGYPHYSEALDEKYSA